MNELKDIYHIIFQKTGTLPMLDFIENNFKQTPERNKVIAFVRGSKRGIIKGSNSE